MKSESMDDQNKELLHVRVHICSGLDADAIWLCRSPDLIVGAL
jgi:hypothetical protein